MGLFASLFRKPQPAVASPDHLRDELFAAANAGDARRLEALARASRAGVLEHFDGWKKAPEAIREDPSAMQAYAQGLIGVAQVFASKLDDPSLLSMLTGPPETNPIEAWQAALREGREHVDALRYAEASALLSGPLAEMQELSGSAVDACLPIAHGLLGQCHFHAGAAEMALPHFEQALVLCEKSGDAEGISASVGSLFEVNRYLGRSEPAADCADHLAKALDAKRDARGAARWRTRAAIVRAGEPLNRIVAMMDDVAVEVDEVRPTRDMRVKFVFERNRIALEPATFHALRGEQLASGGHFEEALASFREAAAADAFDPRSRLHEAFTLVHLRRYAEAVDLYRQVEKLAPGWFQCRADLRVAEQLASGTLDHADFIALHAIEDSAEPPAKKVKLAKALLARRPKLAAAHLQLGRNLARSDRIAEASAALRAGLAAEPDVDVRTRLLVELAATTDGAGERSTLLHEAVTLNGNLVAAASARVALNLT